MEAFDLGENANMKAEKSSSLSPQMRFRGLSEMIKKIFRIMEILLVLVLLTWASSCLPSAFRMSGEYLRRIISIVVGHLFVFIISNVIVLFLFFKSRHLFPQQDSFENTIISETHAADFCGELIGAHFAGERSGKIVYQGKETILEVPAKAKALHRRSQSESLSMRREKIITHALEGDGVKQLRRRVEEKAEIVDELNNEEFQRAIEEFIAKQINFRKEEKLAIVLHGVLDLNMCD